VNARCITKSLNIFVVSSRIKQSKAELKVIEVGVLPEYERIAGARTVFLTGSKQLLYCSSVQPMPITAVRLQAAPARHKLAQARIGLAFGVH
jgi:hypothetical protein